MKGKSSVSRRKIRKEKIQEETKQVGFGRQVETKQFRSREPGFESV